MKNFVKENDIEKSKKASYRITLINKAIDFNNSVLNKCFKELDNIIK